MPQNEYIFYATALIVIATALTRFTPFLFLKRLQGNPHLHFLAANLPPAIMLLLVVYCIKDVQFLKPPHGLPEILSLAAVTVIHLLLKNYLLSIAIGTACYMVLIRVV